MIITATRRMEVWTAEIRDHLVLGLGVARPASNRACRTAEGVEALIAGLPRGRQLHQLVNE
ncbi:hypothetical protein ACGFMK_42295 [Amycolatopsis sp. NPDC049252]|uniref:hypothetical protein n=1 Tax=Amycolatopsis sp. NPDC049252 TaxID=3363933 RepID=UPI00372418B6